MKVILTSLLFGAPLLGGAVTFNKDIAPIIFRACAPCHRPGEAGPFPLLTFQDVHKRAGQIGAVTKRRYMPPWPPEPGYGDFADSRRLSEKELRTIAEWVQQGAPEGNRADLPAAPQFTEGWQLGKPDLIITVPQAFQLPASGGDVFRNFVLPAAVSRTRYVRAIELRPGNKRIVHHANIVIDRGQTLRHQDGTDGQPGFPGMDVVTASVGDFDPDSHFLFWKPGSVPHQEPPDMAWKLDPQTDLILNVHLQPSGKPESIQPSVGIYFTDTPPSRFPVLVQLEHDGALDIPSGEASFAVSDHLVLPVDVEVLGIYPHAHYLGKSIQSWAILPDGTRRWLIRINDWDINWQAVYEYKKPVFLPKGSRIEMRITYDNSTGNPRNPNQPPRRVTGGDRSTDEMGHVWLQLLPVKTSGQDPRRAVQQALMSRRIEKYPGDFVGHYNLGAVLLSQGDTKGAIVQFEAALQAEPADATARNTLGAALLAAGRQDEAVREWRRTLLGDPAFAPAHFNLARVLASEGILAESAQHYEAYLAAKPDDAEALVNLADVYIAGKQYQAAVPVLRRASQLKSGDENVWINLGSALAMQGRYPEAAEAFEKALAIHPGNAVAIENLRKIRARH